MGSHWHGWSALLDIYQSLFQAKAAGTRHCKHQHEVRPGNQQLCLPAPYRRMSRGAGGGWVNRIKLWWGEATSAFPIRAEAEQLPLLFLASGFCRHVVLQWIRGGQLNGSFGKLLSSWSLVVMERGWAEPWTWARVPSPAVPPAQFADADFDS